MKRVCRFEVLLRPASTSKAASGHQPLDDVLGINGLPPTADSVAEVPANGMQIDRRRRDCDLHWNGTVLSPRSAQKSGGDIVKVPWRCGIEHRRSRKDHRIWTEDS